LMKRKQRNRKYNSIFQMILENMARNNAPQQSTVLKNK
jgi:hypothetical protein